MSVMIMETNGREAIALTRDGRFIKIRNAGYQVGQEVLIKPEMIIRSSSRPGRSAVVKIAAVAACFCLLFASIFGLVILNTQSYGYVSVDVNPSIEYRLNRFDRVVSVSAVNEDGEALLSAIGESNLKGADIELALSLTVDELFVQGYLQNEGAGMLISCTAGSSKASLKLSQKLTAYTQSEDALKEVEVITAVVTEALVEEAAALGTTAGKLHLIKSISEDVNVQDWIDKSVTDIYQAVKSQNPELPTDPETEIPAPPEVTIEPDTDVGTDKEPATSAPDPNDTDAPDETTGEITDTETSAESETVTESETETKTETETETETESETEKETETETETEPVTEERTWPETWPDTMPEEWPEEWPEPETDENGNVQLPEPEKKPWWWWLWELIFGKH